MNTGSPLLEARGYKEAQDVHKKRKLEGNWCNFISERGKGYVCFRSPIRSSYEKPCTKIDSIGCPFLENIKGLGIKEEE